MVNHQFSVFPFKESTVATKRQPQADLAHTGGNFDGESEMLWHMLGFHQISGLLSH